MLVEVARSENATSQTPRGSRLKNHCFEEDRFAESLDFGLAIDRDTLEQAFRLQHDQYVAQGYGRVVGTMTLIVDSQLGLPMDQIYAEDLGGIRSERHQLTEASGLALDPDCQRSGVAILMRLIRLITLYAAEVLRSSDICIAVNPRHATFYRKALYFQDFGASLTVTCCECSSGRSAKAARSLAKFTVFSTARWRWTERCLGSFATRRDSSSPSTSRISSQSTRPGPRPLRRRKPFSWSPTENSPLVEPEMTARSPIRWNTSARWGWR